MEKMRSGINRFIGASGGNWQKPRLIMHIGHGNTGSSAIQSFLALNAELLEEFDIHYPQNRITTRAQRGEVTIGNRTAFSSTVDSSDPKTQLISSEIFFSDIVAGNEHWDRIQQTGRSVEIFFYTRDVFDHLLSHWGQRVKRAGYHAGLSACARQYKMQSRVRRVIERLQEADMTFHVSNYSRHSENLIDHFTTWILGDRARDLLSRAKTLKHPVNRSLTIAELELMRIFNEHYQDETPRFLADAIVNRLPHLEAQTPAIDDQVVRRVQEEVEDDVAFINRFLPSDEHVSIDYQAKSSDRSSDQFSFSHEQLQVIVQTLCSCMADRQSE